MGPDRPSGLLLVALQAAAFWPVWPWLVARSLDPSDESQGWLALLTLAVLLVRAGGAGNEEADLRPAALFTGLYAVGFPFLPPLARALLATLALVTGLLGLRPGTMAALPALALGALALPVLPSLQFVAGYPLRVASGELAALALRASGFAVTRQGTLLASQGRLVMIDAPCSGATMLWGALYLAATLAAFGGLGEARTLVLLGFAGVATVLANGLRSALAFLVEAPVFPTPPGTHDALGAAVFAALAVAIVLAQRGLSREGP